MPNGGGEPRAEETTREDGEPTSASTWRPAFEAPKAKCDFPVILDMATDHTRSRFLNVVGFFIFSCALGFVQINTNVDPAPHLDGVSLTSTPADRVRVYGCLRARVHLSEG